MKTQTKPRLKIPVAEKIGVLQNGSMQQAAQAINGARVAVKESQQAIDSVNGSAKPILSELTRADIVKILAHRTGAFGETFNLAGMNLAGIDFSGMDLSRVDFSRADMRGCIFRNCELRAADFRDANLTTADFRGAHTQAVGEGDVIRLSNANLTRADFTNVDLGCADAEGAKFIGANLSETNFTEADLWGAVFTGATTFKTNFTQTKLDVGALDDVNASMAGTSIIADVMWRPNADHSEKPAPVASPSPRRQGEHWWEGEGIRLSTFEFCSDVNTISIQAIRDYGPIEVVIGTLAVVQHSELPTTGGSAIARKIMADPSILDTLNDRHVLDCRGMGTAGMTDETIDRFCEEMDSRLDALGVKWGSGEQNIVMPDGRVRELHEPGSANGDCTFGMYLGPLVDPQ